jgi:hypothetical protein
VAVFCPPEVASAGKELRVAAEASPAVASSTNQPGTKAAGREAALWMPLEIDKKSGREALRAFRCSLCSRWRLRSRWDEGKSGECTNCGEPESVYRF